MRHASTKVGLRTKALDLGLASEVLASGRTVVTVDSEVSILIVRTRLGVFAMENRCPHARFSLADARVRRRTILCARHGREYDLTSGAQRGPLGQRTLPLRTFRVWIDRDHLYLAVSDSSK
jgi:nitrite reductase/ring-hydroxylating ferredoxin subunit